MAGWVTLLTIGFLVLMVMTHAPVGGFLLAAPFVVGLALGWWRLLFPRRLHIDSEGLALSGVGLHPDVTTIAWAEIESVLLEAQWLGQGSGPLHLIVRPVPGDTLSLEVHTDVIDLALGMTDITPVEVALRVRLPLKQWAATSSDPD